MGSGGDGERGSGSIRRVEIVGLWEDIYIDIYMYIYIYIYIYIQGADAIPPTPVLELIVEANKVWMNNIVGLKIESWRGLGG